MAEAVRAAVIGGSGFYEMEGLSEIETLNVDTPFWPTSDVMGLWVELAKRFSQMGGNSGPYFLRMAGKDTFLLSGDVVKALVKAGVVKKKPTTRDARAATQAAFNDWAAETGRPLCQLSRILALSVG